MKLSILSSLLFLVVASVAQAQVPAGSGTLTGSQRLKVPSCGKDGDAVSVAFVLNADGSWAAGEFSGTSTTSGRVTRLSFDAESLVELDAELEDAATELCGEPIAVSSVNITQSLLKVSKRGDRAKLQLKLKAMGAGSSSGSGTFRLKAQGGWQ